MTKPPEQDDSNNRIVAVTLDEESIGRSGPDIEHERAIAIYDLIEQNLFAPEGAVEGPYTLHLAITGNRLMFDIRHESGTPVVAHLLSLTPFRRIVKDYFMHPRSAVDIILSMLSRRSSRLARHCSQVRRVVLSFCCARGTVLWAVTIEDAVLRARQSLQALSPPLGASARHRGY